MFMIGKINDHLALVDYDCKRFALLPAEYELARHGNEVLALDKATRRAVPWRRLPIDQLVVFVKHVDV